MSALSEEKNNVEQEDDYEEVRDSDKTPVTIVTGFLGSGKTTLVNYILKEQNTWKICVVENEFGEVAIDNDLVTENLASREDIITLDNGCVCCSVRGDLVRAFGMLVSRRKEFDAIIIETTGLADPSPIVFTFNSNALIQDNYRIDSVVCLVDAKHINIHLDDKKAEGDINEAEHQIAFADRIVLNKLDLVSKEELEDVEERIKSMNAFATLIKTQNSRAPLDQLLGLNSFSLEQVCNVDPTLMEPEPVVGHDHDGDHVHDEHCGHHVHDEHCGHETSTGSDHEHGHDHHEEHSSHDHGHESGHSDHKNDNDHDHSHAHTEAAPLKKKKVHNLSAVSSVGFTIEGLLNVPLFNTFMSELLKAKAADLYRTKGVLAFSDQGNVKFVFQGVHEQINFGPSEKEWQEGEPRVSKMVFIGKNLDYEYFKTSLLNCTEDPANSKIIMHKR